MLTAEATGTTPVDDHVRSLLLIPLSKKPIVPSQHPLFFGLRLFLRAIIVTLAVATFYYYQNVYRVETFAIR